MMRKAIWLLPVWALLCCAPAAAEQYVDVGDYKIHYIALATDTLRPEIARLYRITRSQNRAMLNVTVLRKGEADGLDRPIEAEIKASATNLAGQRREIDMRLISDKEARYYIGVVRVAHEEVIDFKVDVRPAGAGESYQIVFRQQFFADL